MGDPPNDTAAIVFLLAVVAAAISYSLYLLFRKGRYTTIERLLYAPVYTLARIHWHVEIVWDQSWLRETQSNSRLPPDSMLRDRLLSGAVLIANHRSSMDPFFVQLAAGGRVHWMVAAEYFRHFLFGPLLRAYQAIPTNRGGMDNAATKRAIRLASEGGFVGMFPEGRINRSTAPLLTIRPGAAMVAARGNVPLIPIWIVDAPAGEQVYSPLFMSAHVRVIVGPPCFPPATIEKIESESTGSRSRDANNQWICDAMDRAMKLANIQGEDVCLAGKNWLGS
jgi:1-acyl-sn-glycerol-3-phosphate acyltransferase